MMWSSSSIYLALYPPYLPIYHLSTYLPGIVNDLLRDMLNTFVFVHLDDILIFSRNLEEHVTHVRSVHRRLLDNSLYIKAE